MERELRRGAARSELRPSHYVDRRPRYRRPRLVWPVPQQSGPLCPDPAGGTVRHPGRPGHGHRHVDHAYGPGRQCALRRLGSAQIRQWRIRGHPRRVPQPGCDGGEWVHPDGSFRRDLPGDTNACKYGRGAVAPGVGAEPGSDSAHECGRSPAAGIVASPPANRDGAAELHHGTERAGFERTAENPRRRRFWRGSELDAGGGFHRYRNLRDFSESCRRHLGSFLGRDRNHQDHHFEPDVPGRRRRTSPG